VAFIVIGGFQLAIFGVLLVGCGYAATWIGIGQISCRNVETDFFLICGSFTTPKFQILVVQVISKTHHQTSPLTLPFWIDFFMYPR